MTRGWKADTPTLIDLNRRAVARGATNYLSGAQVAALHPDAGRKADRVDDDDFPEYFPAHHAGYVMYCHNRRDDAPLRGDTIVLAGFNICVRLDRHVDYEAWEGHFIDTTLDEIVALPSEHVEGLPFVEYTRVHFAMAISDYKVESLDEEINLFRHRRRRH